MKNPETILITGASGGIGAALAVRLAAAGKTLFLCARNTKRLNAVKKTCEEKGARVFAEKIDVTDEKDVRNWIRRCHKIAPVDLTIANAGVSVGASGDIEAEEDVRALFDVNINGVVNTVLPTIPLCVDRQKGQIAVLSSLAGYRGLPGAPAYSASKNFVRAWGEALRGCLQKSDVEIRHYGEKQISHAFFDGNRQGGRPDCKKTGKKSRTYHVSETVGVFRMGVVLSARVSGRACV